MAWGSTLAIAPDNGFIIECQLLDTVQHVWSILIIKTDSMGNSSCANYDADMSNISVGTFTDTIFNIPNVALTAFQSNITIHQQNSYLFMADSCSQPLSSQQIFQDNLNSLSIYPNPATDKLNIYSAESEILEIIIYDIISKELLRQKFTSSVTLNTEQLAKGIYLYEVRNKNGVIKKGKVMKD